MNITFLGAAREVTGSCYLVETTDTRFLVDCGMVQGGREAPARNRKPFLLQSYRRDMGGGQFLEMEDLSAPIMVKGRHWGAFRFGLKV